jgi:hypothetical protein
LDEFVGAIGVDTSGGIKDGGGLFSVVGDDLSGGRASDGNIVVGNVFELSVSNSEESSKDD